MNYTEETYLNEKIGRATPFRVPEGYFDQLTSQVMNQLPDRPVKALTASLRPILYAAASVFVAMIIGVTTYFQLQKTDDQELSASLDSSYIDDAVDYAMLDNLEIYACLTEN